MRIYLIDIIKLENQQHTQVGHQQYTQLPHKWTDEQFKDVAEQQGTVYSIEGFQNQWHFGELFEKDLEQHFIRIL